MSMALPPSVGPGLPSNPNSPDYVDTHSKEKLQTTMNTTVKQGSQSHPGAILTKDSLNVSLEVHSPITNEQSQESKPILHPLFRTRFVEGETKAEDRTNLYYQARFTQLPAEIKFFLTENKQLEFEDRDPTLIAEHESLWIGSKLLAQADQISASQLQEEETALRSAHYARLPEQTKELALSLGQAGANFLDGYLSQIGPNHPSYDVYSNVAHLIREGMFLFKSINSQR